MQTEIKQKDCGKRSEKHFRFGDRCGILVRDIMPLDAASCALATCRIQIMGWRKGNHEGEAPRDSRSKPWMGQGRWVHTRMLTHGADVKDFVKTGPRARWVHADNFAAADTLLGCFGGITMKEVLDHFGNVGPNDRIEFDLVDVVEALRPGLLKQADPHAIMTTAASGTLSDGGLA